MSATEAIEHLVAIQAQEPKDPYVGLWTRLDGFAATDLEQLIEKRRAVRTPLLRATIHLVTARDCVKLRPVVQPVLERTFNSSSPFGRRLAGMDIECVLAAGRALVEEQPRSRAELAQLLGDRWPDRDAESLAQAITYLVPVVQVPPRGLWRASGQAKWTTVEAWLGRRLKATRGPDEMVMRYLAAFGPASVSDIRAWCGLPSLRQVVERLQTRLRTFTDEGGRKLFDLPEAPRPDADIPAPARFLPFYDNVNLGHADRIRVVPAEHRARVQWATVLIDGFVRAQWRIIQKRDAATLYVNPFDRLSKSERADVTDEGARLLEFIAPDVLARDVGFTTSTDGLNV